jgi:hypothetical protein
MLSTGCYEVSEIFCSLFVKSPSLSAFVANKETKKLNHKGSKTTKIH